MEDTNTGDASSDAAEREQVMWVFSLTGGELNDKPIVSDDGYRIAYHYDGPPDYARREEFSDCLDGGVDYFTAVRDIMFGEPPATLAFKGKVYALQATFSSSGECECPGRTLHECSGSEDHATIDDDGCTVSVVADGECNGGTECVLCGASNGEPHGYIYLGDGWAELVYRHVDQECDECGETRESGCGCRDGIVCDNCRENRVDAEESIRKYGYESGEYACCE